MRQDTLLTGTAEGAVALVSPRDIEFAGDVQSLLKLGNTFKPQQYQSLFAQFLLRALTPSHSVA